MELKIISPAEDGYVKAIEFNYEELKTGLEASLEKYQGLAYTDETIQEAKKDRAKLNKLKQALNAKKLDIKSKCLAPYQDFEAKIKELMGMVDEPTQAIDSQVKGYEERKREEKRAKIEEFWKETESDIKQLVSLDRIFDKKWLNVTTTMKSIETEITEFLEKVTTELALIEELETEFEDQVVRVYLQEFNVAKAMAENKALIEQKVKREELKRQREEAARKAEEERQAAVQRAAEAKAEAQAQTENAPPVEPEPQTAPLVDVAPEPVAPITKQIDFRVWATPAQLADLKEFLMNNGIKYGPVTHEQAA